MSGVPQIMGFPGRYIQGPGALEQLPGLVAAYGERSLVMATKSMLGRASEALAGNGLVEQFNGECSDIEIARVMELARTCQAACIVAMGGGKVIDCCKVAADRLKLPVIVVPTIASTDAPCSGCAVVYTDAGVFDYVYYQKRNPDVVLLDTTVIAQAPARFLVSGMGDGMATFFEAYSCQQSGSLNECGGLRTITAMSIARLCMDTILENGRTAVEDCQKGRASKAVEAIIEANTLLSGIGFESCGLGFAHSLHNGLTVLPDTHDLFHGEKVAFGVVAGLQLYDAMGMRDEIYDFFIDVGLPVCFADLGLARITDEEIMAVAVNCCGDGNIMFHEPYTIDPATIARAMRDADRNGAARKMARIRPV